MDKHEWLVEVFEAERAHLQSVAYRLLGSLTEADDAVQEAWLHISCTDASSVKNMGGWLTTVVARISLNMLRSRKLRREESLESSGFELAAREAGIVDPEQEALLADSVGLALLVILDTLSPAERLTFVLHDVFAVPFDEIAPIMERSEGATRQLASRARRRIRGGAKDRDEHNITASREVIEAFLAASRAGKFEALLALLDPDVVYREDRAVVSAVFPREVRGAPSVARQLLRGHAQAVQPILVDGAVGIIMAPFGSLLAVANVTIVGGKITEIDVISDPERLGQLHLSLLAD